MTSGGTGGGGGTGSVLPFLRGVDFTDNNFSEDQFPTSVKGMTNLRWIKLDNTNLEWIPDEMGKLAKLESISAAKNNLVSLHGEVGNAMPHLRHLIVRHNRLKTCGIPEKIFSLEELQVVDLSHNSLTEIPSELAKSKALLVLNLSANQITAIPAQLFVNLTQLLHLDLSDNRLETLPPQMRRLVSLQILAINNNPMDHNQLRQLPSMTSLRELHMRNTGRNQQNIPTSLSSLVNLIELDISHNELTQVPSGLYTLPALRRLDLSHNKLTELAKDIGDCWSGLEVLKLSHNRLRVLPASLCKMSQLRRLFINDNELDFDGIPAGIGKLGNLQLLMAAYNYLEMIPEGVTRCGRLKRLILSHNRLVTLPDAIHLLNDLEILDLSHNPDLVMPPKPKGLMNGQQPYTKRGAGIEFYNVDFSLNAQLLKAGAPPSSVPSTAAATAESTPTPLLSKDPIARKMRLRKRREAEEQNNGAGGNSSANKVLKGMSDLARDKYKLRSGLSIADSSDGLLGGGGGTGKDELESKVKPKRWDESLVRPPLDYSDFFDPEDGQDPGLTIWEIENFVPNKIPDELHGKFYEGDCYIILQTIQQDNAAHPSWQIYYWIGQECSLDKKACSAIHAVNLRNYLGAQCRTVREEQGEESDEFLALFAELGGIMYIEGGRTVSGFYTVEETESHHRMYRLHELCDRQRHLHMESVPICRGSLDPRLIYILDASSKIYVWTGAKSKNTMKQKARLLAEKINKEEHKNKATLLFYNQGHEEEDFLKEISNAENQDLDLVEQSSTGDTAIGTGTDTDGSVLLVNGNGTGSTNGCDDSLYSTSTSSTLHGGGGLNSSQNSAQKNTGKLHLTEHVNLDAFKPVKPVVYKVVFGTGYLELPQIDCRGRKMTSAILETKNVYIIDTVTDLFVWLGRKSARLVRAAAQKLALEIFEMVSRPPHSLITRCLEGNEPEILKCKFSHWDDVIAVDFTRTVESVSRTGADLMNWAHNQEVKTDLAALFMPRQPRLMPDQEDEMELELNEDLEKIESFVLERKKFVRLPEPEFGHFFSGDCYVFLCSYIVPPAEPAAHTNDSKSDASKSANSSRANSPGTDADDDESIEQEYHYVVYFWQGREASNMGWLYFTFSLQKKFESSFGGKLEVICQQQQQENMKFLSHFHRKFIIHQGKRVPPGKRADPALMAPLQNVIRLYQLRANGNAITTRCAQVKPAALSLNSAFCFLLYVPYKRKSLTSTSDEENDQNGSNEDLSQEYNGRSSSTVGRTAGLIYVWIGSLCTHKEVELAEVLANEYLSDSPLSTETLSVSVVHEGCEPDLFWEALGGKSDGYDREADYMKYLRLFRCSNDKGYFHISEKCSDFCQDDLANDDIMILDNGSQVFIWVGARSSEVELKLAYKSAQVYVQHMRAKQPDRPRQLLITFKGKESRKFTRSFHGWAAHKELKDPRRDERKYLIAMMESERSGAPMPHASGINH